MFYQLNLLLYTSLFFSYSDITNIAFEVLQGLSFLNAQGIVHRNLSPDNILLTPKVEFFNKL